MFDGYTTSVTRQFAAVMESMLDDEIKQLVRAQVTKRFYDEQAFIDWTYSKWVVIFHLARLARR